MNGEDSSPYLDGEPLIRPFLARRPDGSTRPALPDAPLRGQVRPYLMTGGRTAAARVDVAMETIVVVSDLARVSPLEHVTFERASILADCEQPRSVAEVAARLGLPLMVGLVLVGDLVGEGLLDASTTAPSQADDVAFSTPPGPDTSRRPTSPPNGSRRWSGRLQSARGGRVK